MAGLLNKAAENLSNEQMAQLKEGYQLGMQVMYDKKIFESIMQDANGAPAAQVLAQSVVMILKTIQQKVGELDATVAFALGLTLIGDLADTLQQVGLPLQDGDIEASLEAATQMWLASEGSRYNQDELMAGAQQMGGM